MLGVKFQQNNKLVGIIFGQPIVLNIRDTIIESFDTKLMCVHSKYQGKRLSCILIKELTRRAVTEGKYRYGHFVSKKQIAKPVCMTTFWRSDLSRMSKSLKKNPHIIGEVREMTDMDVIQVL